MCLGGNTRLQVSGSGPVCVFPSTAHHCACAQDSAFSVSNTTSTSIYSVQQVECFCRSRTQFVLLPKYLVPVCVWSAKSYGYEYPLLAALPPRSHSWTEHINPNCKDRSAQNPLHPPSRVLLSVSYSFCCFQSTWYEYPFLAALSYRHDRTAAPKHGQP